MNLPFDYARCVGATFIKRDAHTEAPAFLEPCVDCKRRQPGHPTRQSYVAPMLSEVTICDNRIAP